MLLEALIGILIFSAGIIGLIGLQAASIRSTSEAKYRADAAFLANKVISQMWVDNNLALAATYNGTGGTGGPGYAAWLAEVTSNSTGLPGTTGANSPTIAVGANNTVTVTVRWQRPGDPLVHQYVTTTQIVANPPV
jgi:type IV pilus assembly protein PilV